MFAMIISWTSLKMSYIKLITRSAGQILKKPCMHHRGHVFSPVLLKDGQNVCLDDVMNEFENWTC